MERNIPIITVNYPNQYILNSRKYYAVKVAIPYAASPGTALSSLLSFASDELQQADNVIKSSTLLHRKVLSEARSCLGPES